MFYFKNEINVLRSKKIVVCILENEDIVVYCFDFVINGIFALNLYLFLLFNMKWVVVE